MIIYRSLHIHEPLLSLLECTAGLSGMLDSELDKGLLDRTLVFPTWGKDGWSLRRREQADWVAIQWTGVHRSCL